MHLASGASLEGFAGDGSGGTFFFCGPGAEERPATVEVMTRLRRAIAETGDDYALVLTPEGTHYERLFHD